MKKALFSLIFILTLSNQLFAGVNPYVWSSPSENSAGSMPCGGGDIGLNVWVEKGDILIYLSKNGAFDENNTLLKQGRLRLHLEPNPFENAADFQQTLNLNDGNLSITAGNSKVNIWVDVFKPVVHIETESKEKQELLLSYESWRYQDRLVRKKESDQSTHKWVLPKGLKTLKDNFRQTADGLYFYHQNPDSSVFDMTVGQQGLASIKDQLYNPLIHRISGGKLLTGKMEFTGNTPGKYQDTDFKAWNFISKASAKHKAALVLYAEQERNPADWEAKVDSIADLISSKTDKKKSIQWWNSVWDRSFIHAEGKAAEIVRNYNLFRYMLACNAYGSWPTRFNGGLFTFDPVNVDTAIVFTPDYRRWTGGTFTAQNQRLVYWPMLKNGDDEWMKPEFDFYRNNLRNAEARTEFYWAHKGACFTEQIENFGLPNPSEYGWKRPAEYDKGRQYNAWLEYQYDTVLEFCEMILETSDQQDIRAYLPLIESSLDFFFVHYDQLARKRGRKNLDQDKHLIFYPSSGLETYKMAKNPANLIAGLNRVINSLRKYGAENTRLNLDSLQRLIPPLSFRELDGKVMISPASSWERLNNTEDPQLYPVFPWRMFGVGKAGLDTARNTYFHDPDVQRFRSHVGWKQDLIFAACLGLTDEAKELALKKMSSGHYRFPAFWGPGFDWSPDHNWGGSGMIGMQEMLLQETDEGKILLFPTWPREWDVEFKLHLSGNTTVEAKLENGQIKNLKITPEERSKDILDSL